MCKRTATVSARLTPELEAQIQVIALADDITVSDLIYRLLSDHAAVARARWEKLKPAFGERQDLPGQQR